MNSIIPKLLFEDEDIITLKDKGIKIEEGIQTINKFKIPCYKFYNISEMEVFDELNKNSLLEANNDSIKNSYANRMMTIIYLRIRQVATMTDPEKKLSASCALCAAVNSLADININYAQRFLPLLRSLG